MNLKRFAGLCVIAVTVLAALLSGSHGVQAAGATTIGYGDTVEGQVGGKTWYNVYEFEGTQGDHVVITMTGDGSLDPYLGLLDATTQEVLVEDDDSAGNSNALIETDLPATGPYLIVATRYGLDTGTSEGSYTLQLQGGKGPASTTANVSSTNQTAGPQMVEEGIYLMGTLVIDQDAVGEITDDMFAQIYELQVEAQTELGVMMYTPTNGSLDPYLMFLDTDGRALARDDNGGAALQGGGPLDAFMRITVREAGTYYVVATRAGIAEGTTQGDYTLFAIVRSGGEPSDTPAGVADMGLINIGDTVEGTIDDETYIHVYQFDGDANEQVTITVVGSGGLDAYLGLMDPSEAFIAEDDDSGGDLNPQISLRLPETGRYVIVVTRAGIDEGTTSGDYALALSSGAPAAPQGSSGLGGFGGLPSRALDTDQGTLYLRGFGRTTDPAKASPLQRFVVLPVVQLPGR